MWKKFQDFPLSGLQNIIDKNPFFGPAKTRAAALHKVTFV